MSSPAYDWPRVTRGSPPGGTTSTRKERLHILGSRTVGLGVVQAQAVVLGSVPISDNEDRRAEQAVMCACILRRRRAAFADSCGRLGRSGRVGGPHNQSCTEHAWMPFVFYNCLSLSSVVCAAVRGRDSVQCPIARQPGPVARRRGKRSSRTSTTTEQGWRPLFATQLTRPSPFSSSASSCSPLTVLPHTVWAAWHTHTHAPRYMPLDTANDGIPHSTLLRTTSRKAQIVRSFRWILGAVGRKTQGRRVRRVLQDGCVAPGWRQGWRHVGGARGSDGGNLGVELGLRAGRPVALGSRWHVEGRVLCAVGRKTQGRRVGIVLKRRRIAPSGR